MRLPGEHCLLGASSDNSIFAPESSYIGRYGGYSSPTTRVDSNLYSACLQARGWRLVRAGVPPPMVPPPPQAVTPPPQAVASAAIAPPQAVAPSKADDPYVQLGHEFARSAMTSLRTWRHPTKAPYTWMPDGSACMQLLATPESNEALTYEFVTSQSPAMIDRINKNRYDPQVVAAFRVFFNEAAWERIRSCMRDKGWQEAKR
jgi:hypothetical protein